MPPVTGSTRVIGRDGDRQRVGEGGADRRLLRRAAGDGSERESLALEGADVGMGESSGSPRWSVVMPADGGAGADGRAAGEQGHGLGRPAVVAQRGQQRIDGAGGGAHLVAGGGEPAGAVPVADQVVTRCLVDRPEEVAGRCRSRRCPRRSCR